MSNKQTKVISPDWTLIAPLPELPPSLSVGQFSFLYSDLRSFKVESARNREAPAPGHSWSPKESHLSVDTAQDCWTLERPAVSAAPEMPTKFSYDVQHFIYLFFLEMYKSIITLKEEFQTKTTVRERWLILCQVSFETHLRKEKGHMMKQKSSIPVTLWQNTKKRTPAEEQGQENRS